MVDDKIYDNIENELKRYAKDYIQQKYQNSKALVLKLNTKEYTAPEIVKLLENLYFDGEKSKSSQLIGTILVGEIPFPVVQYQDYFFPSIYPYVDFLDQKYLRNPDTQYFSQAQENGQAEIWHGVINFQADTQKYKDFFAKLKIYNSDPEKFVDKKIWYDDFIALQSNMLEENEKLYKNKLAFAEDLIYHRYTDLLFNTLKGNNEQEIQTLLNGFAENLKEV
ncbi:MAG: hypothetical protein Q4B28_03825 [bacterium]|nr:hypothetical protein [bacterium]